MLIVSGDKTIQTNKLKIDFIVNKENKDPIPNESPRQLLQHYKRVTTYEEVHLYTPMRRYHANFRTLPWMERTIKPPSYDFTKSPQESKEIETLRKRVYDMYALYNKRYSGKDVIMCPFDSHCQRAMKGPGNLR
jgi:hypothetical protein